MPMQYSPLTNSDLKLRIDPSPKGASPLKPRMVEEPTEISDECIQFIKLIGRPPPNSDDAITMPPYNISMGDPRKYCIDVLEGENEDPFTLESLQDLIKLHAENEKDFILARVCTGIIYI